MIARLFWIVFLLPVAIVLIALSVANRNIVPLTFDPFNAANPYLTTSAPLFVFLFGCLVIGLVMGSLTTWFAQGKHRRKLRQQQIELDLAKAELQKRDAQLRNNSLSISSS